MGVSSAPRDSTQIVFLLLFFVFGALLFRVNLDSFDRDTALILTGTGLPFAAALGARWIGPAFGVFRILLAPVLGAVAAALALKFAPWWPGFWILMALQIGMFSPLWLPHTGAIRNALYSLLAALPALTIPAPESSFWSPLAGASLSLGMVAGVLFRTLPEPSPVAPSGPSPPPADAEATVLLLESRNGQDRVEVTNRFVSPSGLMRIDLVEAGADYAKVENAGNETLRLSYPQLRPEACVPGQQAVLRPGHCLIVKFEVWQVSKAGTELAGVASMTAPRPRPAPRGSDEYLALDEFD